MYYFLFVIKANAFLNNVMPQSIRAPFPLNSWPLKAGYATGLFYQMVDYFSVEYKTFIIVAKSLTFLFLLFLPVKITR